MKSLYIITVYLAVALQGTEVRAWTNYLNFDSCYTYQIHNVNEDQSYQITWNGNPITTWNCKIGLHGYNSDYALNSYQVCIQATNWNIQNTKVQMKYYTGISDILTRTYTYYSLDSPTVEWCSNSAEYVDIELVTDSSSYNQGSITLQVRGVITYNYNTVIGWSVGGAIGGVILISLCVIVVVAVACRRRRIPNGGITYGTPTAPATIITQSGSQHMGGYYNQGYGNNGAPPSYYPANMSTPVGYYEQPPYQQYSTPANAQQTTATSTTSEQTTKEQK